MDFEILAGNLIDRCNMKVANLTYNEKLYHDMTQKAMLEWDEFVKKNYLNKFFTEIFQKL